jgi:hypothetical protein
MGKAQIVLGYMSPTTHAMLCGGVVYTDMIGRGSSSLALVHCLAPVALLG